MISFWKTKKTLKIFRGITEEAVQEILDACARENFKAGETIMEQGELPNSKGYIIETWSVDVWTNEEYTSHLEQGDIFGEIALLNEEPRSAKVVAEVDTITIILSQETLFHMIENDDNSINKEIMRRMEENLENE